MDTNPNGSVPLDVNTGAAAIMGLMGGEEGEQPTPEAQEERKANSRLLKPRKNRLSRLKL